MVGSGEDCSVLAGSREVSTKDLLLASIGLNIAIISVGIVFAIRVYGRLARMEEWARLTEKRMNGHP